MQAKAFELSVDGRTTRSIGSELGISEHTAASYIRIEERRRADELQKRRDTAQARSIASYENIKQRALKRAGNVNEIIEAIKDGKSDARINDHSLDAALKAQERADKIQGLDAPTRLETGIQVLVNALDGK